MSKPWKPRLGLAATQPTAGLSWALGFPSSLPYNKDPVSPTAVDVEKVSQSWGLKGFNSKAAQVMEEP